MLDFDIEIRRKFKGRITTRNISFRDSIYIFDAIVIASVAKGTLKKFMAEKAPSNLVIKSTIGEVREQCFNVVTDSIKITSSATGNLRKNAVCQTDSIKITSASPLPMTSNDIIKVDNKIGIAVPNIVPLEKSFLDGVTDSIKIKSDYLGDIKHSYETITDAIKITSVNLPITKHVFNTTPLTSSIVISDSMGKYEIRFVINVSDKIGITSSSINLQHRDLLYGVTDEIKIQSSVAGNLRKYGQIDAKIKIDSQVGCTKIVDLGVISQSIVIKNSNVNAVRRIYRLHADIDSSKLADIDSMTLEDLDYITIDND